MLTRLKVSGFKNLVDVDVRFGPFTCVAGANGVGKSNLFDAVTFLSALADRPLIDAAMSVRGEGGNTADLRSLFHRVGSDYTDEMSFEVEMIVPTHGLDDLGQMAEATITFLSYSLRLAYRVSETTSLTSGTLELVREQLVHINLGDAKEALLFPHSPSWRRSAIKGRRAAPFISTEEEDGRRIIKLHQDGNQGRPRSLLATNLPRTVLSAANAAESPTTLLARREMRSWRLLQLEPSSLRRPDEFQAPTVLGPDGSHLAATLYRLAHASANNGAAQANDEAAEARVYAEVANRLALLIDDVNEVRIERDQVRELLTLQVSSRDTTLHPARSLSDGTLRFLALAVLERDPDAQGLLCLEEPENGIHPRRIPAILQLLQDIVTDVHGPVGPDNPLRQVIINTHSPSVVSQVHDDSLLVATLQETIQDGKPFKRVCLGSLPDTWRASARDASNIISKGHLLAYLNPVEKTWAEYPALSKDTPQARRVVDRPDLQALLPLFADSE